MGQYSSYYLYQKYEKRGDQPFVPVYPAVYSVDGDGTREPVVKNENDYQCGWTGETGTLYRWVDLPIDTDYVCDECPEPIYRWVETTGYMCNGVTKFNREVKQVSYDEGISWHDTADYRAGSTIIEQKSADCGYAERWVETGEYRCEYTADTPDAQYRWVNMPIETDYECVDTSKYYKQKYQVSTDSGVTWSDVVPAQYRVGDLYEASSLDCGAEATYRWYRLPINEGYVCSGTSKYYKEVYQVSTDSGSTWNDVVPAQYRTGDLNETDSLDCGSMVDFSREYLTIVPLEPAVITYYTAIYEERRPISYSLDGGSTWIEGTTDSSGTVITANTGQKVMFKGNLLTQDEYMQYVGDFKTNGYRCNVQGNVMSLLYGDNFIGQTNLYSTEFMWLFEDTQIVNAHNLILPATALTEKCYYGMFANDGLWGERSLETAPALPATTLAKGCYCNMFEGCYNLVEVPSILPATTLTESCYDGMFTGCRSLKTTPQLPATTLANYCYKGMFHGCSSLTTAPELPAATLTEDCYRDMFGGCTKLNYIKCLATDISAEECTAAWVVNVATTGTFVKAANMSGWAQDHGGSAIPYGWTIENA